MSRRALARPGRTAHPAARRLALVGALAALLALSAPIPALAATATGRVVMGTAGATVPEGLRVTVLQNSDEGEPQGQPSFVPVAPDGSFSFEADPATGHLIGLFYKEAAYSEVLEPGQVEGIELTIYETTNDVSVVKVASDSMTILQSSGEGQSDVLEVLQLLRFRNDSDRTYTGSESDRPPPSESEAPEEPRQILQLPLPESAFDLAPADPGNSAGLATTGGRLVVTSPLVPGETSVAYLFKVQVPRSGWQLRREIHHPTDHMDLLVDTALELTAAPGFRFEESTNLGGQEYNRYRAGARNPGAVLEADIGFTGGSTTGVWFGFGTAAAVLGALFFAGSIRMRRRRAADALAARSKPGDDPASGDGPAARQELIDRVAALDEEFDAGTVEEDAYRARRSELISRLGGPAGGH